MIIVTVIIANKYLWARHCFINYTLIIFQNKYMKWILLLNLEFTCLSPAHIANICCWVLTKSFIICNFFPISILLELFFMTILWIWSNTFSASIKLLYNGSLLICWFCQYNIVDFLNWTALGIQESTILVNIIFTICCWILFTSGLFISFISLFSNEVALPFFLFYSLSFAIFSALRLFWLDEL